MLSRVRKGLIMVVLAACAPCVAHMTEEAAAPGAQGLIAGYVDDGDYKPSFELMDLNPPVSWLSEWLVV